MQPGSTTPHFRHLNSGSYNYLDTTKLIRNILRENSIQIDDTIAKSQPLQQTNGVLQGDPLSPLLFIIATADITKGIQCEKNVKFYAYADDMVLVANSVEGLQQCHRMGRWERIASEQNKNRHDDVQKGRKTSYYRQNSLWGSASGTRNRI
jgi:hypothetical protein